MGGGMAILSTSPPSLGYFTAGYTYAKINIYSNQQLRHYIMLRRLIVCPGQKYITLYYYLRSLDVSSILLDQLYSHISYIQ